MVFERTIKEAFDKLSGEILKADDIFDKAKDAFLVRKQFHKNEIELYCLECQQKLNVSTSKYDRLHFKHNPNADYCLLKDGKLSPDESEKIYAIYRSKESERHKFLKNQIGKQLSLLGDVSNVQIDDKFIFDSNSNEKRKPDVYCKYLDKEIVFEIQLSDLSLRYIISRHEFYQRNGIYLIWILDKFNAEGKKQTERDIKYLTEYQNFFKFDEKSEQFRLICKYKFPFLNERNRLMNKWKSRSLALSQIKFDKETKQAYYYDFHEKISKKKEEQLKKEKELEEQQIIAEKKRKENEATEKSEYIISLLKENWINGQSCGFAKREIEELNNYEISILNKSNAFKPENGQPKIHRWFKIAKEKHIHFLYFILECKQLTFDFNLKSKDNKTIIQTLTENPNLHSKSYLIRQILKNGYVFKNSDRAFINKLPNKAKENQVTEILCELSTKIRNKSLIDDLFEHQGLICIIESAKRNEIVGFGWKGNQWIAFANNAIEFYSQYWEYIELAFKHYGIWERLIELDKKGSFQKKLKKYYETSPDQNYDCDILFRYLYNELSE